MLRLLLNTASRLSFCLPLTMASRLGVGKRLGEEIARTANLNWPKGYSIPDEIMLSKKSPGKGREGHSWLRCLSSQETHAELSRKVAKHLPADWVVVNKFLIPCLHAQLFLTLFKLSLSWSMSLFVCFLFLTHCTGERSEGGCLAGSTYNTL